MKNYESKILLFLLISIVFAFLVMNFVIISYVKNQMIESLDEKIVLMITTQKKYSSGVLITKEKIKRKGFIFYKKLGDKYVYLEKGYLKRKIAKLSYYLFLWESVIILSISLLYYLVVYRFLRIRKEYGKIFEIALLVLNHKLRNFLFSMKLNLNLIKNNYDLSVISRMENAVDLLEEENREISERLKEINKLSKIKYDKLNVWEIINEIIENHFLKEKLKILIKGRRNVFIVSKKEDLKIIFYFLIDNMFRYGEKYGIIKIVKYRKNVFVMFKNDIGEKEKSGFGLGLTIVEKLCEENEIIIRRKVLSKKFFVILKIKNKIFV